MAGICALQVAQRQRQRRLVVMVWGMMDGPWVDKGKGRQKRARQRVFGSEGLANLPYPLPKVDERPPPPSCFIHLSPQTTLQKPVISSLSLSSSLRWHWHLWLVCESSMLEG